MKIRVTNPELTSYGMIFAVGEPAHGLYSISWKHGGFSYGACIRRDDFDVLEDENTPLVFMYGKAIHKGMKLYDRVSKVIFIVDSLKNGFFKDSVGNSFMTENVIFVKDPEQKPEDEQYVKVRHEHMVYYILTTNCAFVHAVSHLELMQNAKYAVNLSTNKLEKCRDMVTNILDKALFDLQ